jgi:hypothetical protein
LLYRTQKLLEALQTPPWEKAHCHRSVGCSIALGMSQEDGHYCPDHLVGLCKNPGRLVELGQRCSLAVSWISTARSHGGRGDPQDDAFLLSMFYFMMRQVRPQNPTDIKEVLEPYLPPSSRALVSPHLASA